MKTLRAGKLIRRFSDEDAEVMLRTGKWALCPDELSPFKGDEDELRTKTDKAGDSAQEHLDVGEKRGRKGS